MSDHQRETAFLRHCLSFDESPQRQELEEGITRIQRDERCVRSAVWLMAILAALSVAGLGYAAALADNFPYSTPQFVLNAICALGLAALICLLTFVCLGMVCRQKLNRRREECRQLVMKLLESRLGKPAVASPPGVVNTSRNTLADTEPAAPSAQQAMSGGPQNSSYADF
jgi:hypothetical protein